jgi:hypothetical protein
LKIFAVDSRTGERIKLIVEDSSQIERIKDIVVKQMGINSFEQLSYKLVLNNKELPKNTTLSDTIHKYLLKKQDTLIILISNRNKTILGN